LCISKLVVWLAKKLRQSGGKPLEKNKVGVLDRGSDKNSLGNARIKPADAKLRLPHLVGPVPKLSSAAPLPNDL
jgi:hypothetical protein